VCLASSATLLSLRVCILLVEQPEGLDERSPQLAARGVTLTLPLASECSQVLRVPRMPLRMTGLHDNTKAGPALGADNDALLSMPRAKL